MSVQQIRKLVDSAALFTVEEEQGNIIHGDELAPPLWELPSGITAEEFEKARPSPDCIVEKLLYADVGLLIAPGGTGKTTLVLWVAIHVVLGFPLFGLEIVKSGPVLIITAEDSREMLVARLRAIADAIGLDETERERLRQGIRLSDVSGETFRLTKVESDLVNPSAGLDYLIKGCQELKPVLVVIDPAVSFGVGESRVNDAEQGLIEAARKLKRAISCCVLYIHHSGKQNARDKATDQYAGRGGSAFPDGSRMVFVLQNVLPADWSKSTGRDLAEGETGLVLARPKMSYCPPQGKIMISRIGYSFEHVGEMTESMERESSDDRVFRFLMTEFQADKRHTKSTLEAFSESPLGLKRAEIRDAVERLLSSGRVELLSVPSDKKPRRGGAHTYLHPNAPPQKYGDHRS